MADTKRLVVTREGLQKMKEELEYKETTEKMRIAEQLKVAISYGDLSENAEYDAAKNDQASLEQRINELKAMIENAVVVDESKINTDAVNFGTRVTIIDLDDEDAEEEVMSFVRRIKVQRLRSKTVTPGGVELTVEVQLRERFDIVNKLLDTEGVHSATLIACQSEAGN